MMQCVRTGCTVYNNFSYFLFLFWFCFDFSGILSAIKDIYHVLLASSQRYNLMFSGIFFFFSFSYLQFSQRWQGHMLKRSFREFSKRKKRKERKKNKWENQNRPTPTLKSKKMFNWHVSSSTWYVSNFIKFGLIILTNYDVI